jgi:hypothetical protein
MSFRIWNRVTTAGVGVASILAGSAALGAAVYLQASTPSWAKQTAANGNDSGYTTEVALPMLPELSGQAVVNRVRHRAVSTLRSTPESAPVAANEPASACQPFWHRLETGPVGEMVLVTCPGEEGQVPPEPPHQVDPSHSQLPTVGDFVEPIVQEPLVAIGHRASHAGQVVAGSLERESQRFQAGIMPPTVPPTPDFGALDWAPQVKSST